MCLFLLQGPANPISSYSLCLRTYFALNLLLGKSGNVSEIIPPVLTTKYQPGGSYAPFRKTASFTSLLEPAFFPKLVFLGMGVM